MTIESDGAIGNLSNRPLAAAGLTSFRYRGQFGWIMIGANDIADALREAARSTTEVSEGRLEIWDGEKYIATSAVNPLPHF